MRKTILSVAAAGALAVAGVTTASQPAQAFWWIIPAVIGGAVVGAGAGAAVTAASDPYASEPHGDVKIQPNGCHMQRERVNGVWRNVQVCG